MRERWLSGRAVVLHVVAVVAAAGCALATWWQITRAADGNQLSYFYSAMWPAFFALVVFFWWTFLHTDFESAGRRGVARQQADQAGVPGSAAADSAGATLLPLGVDEDPELVAYNAWLAELAEQGPRTWRHRESVITRAPTGRSE